jgi:hypothetical protein
MKDANLIASAVKQLNVKDDAQWEPDGAPKLELIQRLANDKDITVDDVQEAIGAFKRGDKLKAQPPTQSKAPESKDPALVAATAADTPAENEPPLESLDPNSPEYADRIVRAARAEDGKLKAQVDDCERKREVLSDEIRKLTAARDAQIILIERFAPRISHAQAVKAIQGQTQRTLADQRVRLATAATILGPHGTPVNYASKLDASMAMRKRTAEQSANYAKFVHQSAAASAPPV